MAVVYTLGLQYELDWCHYTGATDDCGGAARGRGSDREEDWVGTNGGVHKT